MAEAEATVAAKQAELKEVMDMVADLEAQLHEANEKAKELQRNQKDSAFSPCFYVFLIPFLLKLVQSFLDLLAIFWLFWSSSGTATYTRGFPSLLAL